MWPWEAEHLKSQIREESALAFFYQTQAEAAVQEAQRAQVRASRLMLLAVAGAVAAAVVIYRLRKCPPVIKNYIRGQVVENVVRQEVILRRPAHELVPNCVTIDGTNVICGSCSGQKPSLLTLMALLHALSIQKCCYKCFFDANTFYTLTKAGKEKEAYAYRRFCHDFPDVFVEVPSSNTADSFILDYAHSHGTPVISNDLFRDHVQKYAWVESDQKRRISFLMHSNLLQIVPLGIQVQISTELATAEESLRSRLGKSTEGPKQVAHQAVKAVVPHDARLIGKVVKMA